MTYVSNYLIAFFCISLEVVNANPQDGLVYNLIKLFA
jgi:hypothetical protein